MSYLERNIWSEMYLASVCITNQKKLFTKIKILKNTLY